MRAIPAGDDFDGWVRQLAISYRRQQAKRHLLTSGPPAVPALRRGLRHPQAVVRQVCAGVLDHLVDQESVPALVAALDDPDPRVQGRALHALACDRCKENECRPGEDLWVGRALELMHDADPDVRASAIDALGNVVRRRPDVEAALRSAAAFDRHPGLRNLAGRMAKRADKPPART